MCFLKTLKPLDDITLEKRAPSLEAANLENQEKLEAECSYLNGMLNTQTPVLLSRQDQLLFDLLTQVKSNQVQM
jgi:hypothetical protein